PVPSRMPAAWEPGWQGSSAGALLWCVWLPGIPPSRSCHYWLQGEQSLSCCARQRSHRSIGGASRTTAGRGRRSSTEWGPTARLPPANLRNLRSSSGDWGRNLPSSRMPGSSGRQERLEKHPGDGPLEVQFAGQRKVFVLVLRIPHSQRCQNDPLGLRHHRQTEQTIGVGGSL